MKKVLLVCAAVAMVSLCSCSKYKDCECTYSLAGVSITAPVVSAETLEENEITCAEWQEQQASIYAGIKCVEL